MLICPLFNQIMWAAANINVVLFFISRSLSGPWLHFAQKDSKNESEWIPVFSFPKPRTYAFRTHTNSGPMRHPAIKIPSCTRDLITLHSIPMTTLNICAFNMYFQMDWIPLAGPRQSKMPGISSKMAARRQNGRLPAQPQKKKLVVEGRLWVFFFSSQGLATDQLSGTFGHQKNVRKQCCNSNNGPHA